MRLCNAPHSTMAIAALALKTGCSDASTTSHVNAGASPRPTESEGLGRTASRPEQVELPGGTVPPTTRRVYLAAQPWSACQLLEETFATTMRARQDGARPWNRIDAGRHGRSFRPGPVVAVTGQRA